MSSKKILVIDDDPSVLDTYKKLLIRCGYETITAGNGFEILNDLEKLKEVELIILDYKMPVIDGLSLLVEIKKKGFMPKVILISAYLTDDVKRRAKFLGVETIFRKPVDIVKLKESIKETLRC
jgi:CheY-like chemotaxis protein